MVVEVARVERKQGALLSLHSTMRHLPHCEQLPKRNKNLNGNNQPAVLHQQATPTRIPEAVHAMSINCNRS